MLKITDFRFSLLMVAKSEEVLVTEATPFKDYTDGKPSENIAGYKYNVVCPTNKYEPLAVKIRQSQPTITNEQIEAAGGAIKVTFVGFEGKFYRTSNGDYAFTAKADRLEVVQNEED